MLIQKAFKFELRPDGAQQRGMRRAAGCRRFVMNKALDIQQKNYAAGGKYIGYAALCKQLTDWRAAPKTSWLAVSPVHTQQQALKDIDKAFQNFFGGRADFPTPKKKGRADSFRFPDAKQFKVEEDNALVFLPKLGWMRYRKSRAITGDLRSITVSASCGKWFASIQTQQEVAQPLPISTTAVGIDVGITRFATLSDGAHLDPLNSFKRHEQRLAKYQRRMSRKKKFSSNWKKAKAKVTRIYSDIAKVRQDYLQKATTTLSKNHALVAVEDLQISNMSKSAKGTQDAPGKNVRAKAGLNRAILDQGWGEFRRQLEYKLDWNGGTFIAVPAAYTSQTCPCCHSVDKKSRQSQAKFLCTTCWYENHADVVGAINVLDRAFETLAAMYGNECQTVLSIEGQDTADASAGCASTARIACEVNGVVTPSATGTRRVDMQEVLYAQ